jgi:hypothetical protein
MLGLTVRAAKRNFFDREKVQRAVDRATHRTLSKFGAFVRQRARTSIRYRKKTSAPGTPPHARRSMLRLKKRRKDGSTRAQMVSPLREFIFFAYEESRKSVVIGPALLNGRTGAKALKALEYGGPSVIVEERTGKRKQITIRARPFMRPARDAELPAFRQMLKNSVR